MGVDEPGRRRSRPVDPPLYDARFEHDACGVGFVADAGGGAHDRVLPLALSGLAALGHRGAFGADGASSDGAGILCRWSRGSLRRWSARGPTGVDCRRPGVVSLFLPRGATAGARGPREVALAAEGLAAGAWRPVPFEPGVLGPSAAAARPAVVQLVVPRPADLGRRLRGCPRPGATPDGARRSVGGLAGFAVASASARTIVYKGLVAGGRLAELYPDLAQPLPSSHAIFHQRYATNTMPTWSLAQPFRLPGAQRRDQHRARQPRAGPRDGLGDRRARRPRDACSRRAAALAGRLRLGLARRGGGGARPDRLVARVGPARAAARRPALRRGRARPGQMRADERGHPLAPWDGPAAIVFSDGRRVGAILDRNGLRPLAYTVTAERLVAAASEAGAFELPAASVARRGRLGPGEMLVVEPAAGRIHLAAEAESSTAVGRAASGRSATERPVRGPGIDDADAASGADAGAVRALPATEAGLRFLAGLDAERYRLDIRTMVLEGHEPLWSMGDDTPTPALARTDRPVADHLRQAFAQVTNPPIDAERERAVVDLGVELGPRASIFGGPRVAPLPGVVPDAAPGATVRGRHRRAAGRRSHAGAPARRHLVGRRRGRRIEAALERLAARALASARRASGCSSSRTTGFSFDRLPIPSVLAVGAVHAALTAAGLRGRTDILLDAADVLDVHAAAMAIAAGAGAVHPRLAIELAAELAGTRGAEELTPGQAVARLLDAFEAGLRKTLARMGICTVASYVGGVQFETLELSEAVVERCFPAAAAWPGGLGFAELAARQVARAEAAHGRRPRDAARLGWSIRVVRAVPRGRRGARLCAVGRAAAPAHGRATDRAGDARGSAGDAACPAPRARRRRSGTPAGCGAPAGAALRGRAGARDRVPASWPPR